MNPGVHSNSDVFISHGRSPLSYFVSELAVACFIKQRSPCVHTREQCRVVSDRIPRHPITLRSQDSQHIYVYPSAGIS